MNGMNIFTYGSTNVRALEIDGAPWFVGKDVAEALAYTNPQKAVRDHVDNEDKGVNKTFTPGGEQKTIIINESGMYSLIFGSRLESARRFKRWVTSEVLPALRRTGSYTAKARSDPAFARAAVLSALAKSLSEVRKLYESGLLRAKDAGNMAMSALALTGADAPHAVRAARKKSGAGLAASVGLFFRERIRFTGIDCTMTAQALYSEWCRWSGVSDVPRKQFSTQVIKLFPAILHKQIRTGTAANPEWHFCGIELRADPGTKAIADLTETENIPNVPPETISGKEQSK